MFEKLVALLTFSDEDVVELEEFLARLNIDEVSKQAFIEHFEIGLKEAKKGCNNLNLTEKKIKKLKDDYRFWLLNPNSIDEGVARQLGQALGYFTGILEFNMLAFLIEQYYLPTLINLIRSQNPRLMPYISSRLRKWRTKILGLRDGLAPYQQSGLDYIERHNVFD